MTDDGPVTLRLPAGLGSLALVTALLAWAPTASAADAPTAKDGAAAAYAPVETAVADGVIVQLEEQASSARVATAVESLDAGVEVEERTALGGGITALTTADTLEPAAAQDLADELEQRSDVLWAEPDYRRTTADAAPVSVNDPLVGQQRHLWDTRTAKQVAPLKLSAWPAGGYGVKAPSMWRTTRGSSGVTVAVVDTGIQSHPDLDGAILPGYDFVLNDGRSGDGQTGRDNDPTDPGDWCGRSGTSSWHGTHVAGLIAARADNGTGGSGVAPGVSVLPVRALGRCNGSDSDILAAIRWSAGLSVPGTTPNEHPAHVINLSLGSVSECTRGYRKVLAEVRAKGAVVVVAAGNESIDVKQVAPANCPGTLAVAATSEYGDLAAYSNYGSGIDVSAPGGDSAWYRSNDGQGALISTWNAGKQGPGSPAYGRMEGTSMAAPVVAAAVALYRSAGITSVTRLEQAVTTAVAPFPTSRASGFSRCTTARCGSGIVDLSALPRTSSASVTGSAKPGRTLTAHAPVWTFAASSVARRWFVGGKATSSTGTTYTVKRSDAGKTVEVRYTAHRAGFRPTMSAARRTVPRATAKVSFSAPSKASTGARPRVTVKIRVTGVRPTGVVKIVEGGRTIARVTVKASAKGVVKVRLPKLRDGKHRLRATYSGSPAVASARSAVKTVTVR